MNEMFLVKLIFYELACHFKHTGIGSEMLIFNFNTLLSHILAFNFEIIKS